MNCPYEEEWIIRFKEINNRKPSHLEKITFRVGMNAGIAFQETRQKKTEVKQ